MALVYTLETNCTPQLEQCAAESLDNKHPRTDEDVHKTHAHTHIQSQVAVGAAASLGRSVNGSVHGSMHGSVRGSRPPSKCASCQSNDWERSLHTPRAVRRGDYSPDRIGKQLQRVLYCGRGMPSFSSEMPISLSSLLA
eukprot:668264-Pelagomonas_calceolata.AAC.12